LLVSDILIRFCERIPYAFVVLWVMNHARLDAQQFGYLVSFENDRGDGLLHSRRASGRQVWPPPICACDICFFTLFSDHTDLGNSFGWLALAFVVRV